MQNRQCFLTFQITRESRHEKNKTYAERSNQAKEKIKDQLVAFLGPRLRAVNRLEHKLQVRMDSCS